MDKPRIHISTVQNSYSPIYTEITIDGVPLKGVRSWKLEQGVGNAPPTLTVDLNVFNLSTDTAVILKQAGLTEIESITLKEYGTIRF